MTEPTPAPESTAFTMRGDILEEWCEALESGRYKQTREVLKDANGYCCLGVLCDIASKHGFGGWHEDEDDDGHPLEQYHWWADGDSERELLPGTVYEWAGVIAPDEIAPSVWACGKLRALTELNDGSWEIDALTFTQIAALLRQQVKPIQTES
jgi:hypothetical protein